MEHDCHVDQPNSKILLLFVICFCALTISHVILFIALFIVLSFCKIGISKTIF